MLRAGRRPAVRLPGPALGVEPYPPLPDRGARHGALRGYRAARAGRRRVLRSAARDAGDPYTAAEQTVSGWAGRGRYDRRVASGTALASVNALLAVIPVNLKIVLEWRCIIR